MVVVQLSRLPMNADTPEQLRAINQLSPNSATAIRFAVACRYADTRADWVGPDAVYKRIQASQALAELCRRFLRLTVARSVAGDTLDAETARTLSRAESPRQALNAVVGQPEFQWSKHVTPSRFSRSLGAAGMVGLLPGLASVHLPVADRKSCAVAARGLDECRARSVCEPAYARLRGPLAEAPMQSVMRIDSMACLNCIRLVFLRRLYGRRNCCRSSRWLRLPAALALRGAELSGKRSNRPDGAALAG